MKQYEIDGVPALFVKATGPLRAGLMFRVGRVDEPLPLAGVSHLAEHLALHRHGLMDHHANATVDATTTHFHTSGTAAEVVTYFAKLCTGLIDLPVDRLGVVREILRTEAAGRGGGVNASLPLWRYGAQGYGLVSYAEFGLNQISGDDVRSWVTENFTRDNAVLWVAGDDVPADLRLDLPPGRRRPLPAPTSALPDTPAYYHAPVDGIVMDTVVPNGVAGQLFAALLERALYRELRLESGISYTACADYSSRGDGMATITAYADALREKHTAAVNGFVDTFRQLAKAGIDEQELNAVRTKALQSLAHPEYEASRLPGVAANLLTGQPVPTVDEVSEGLRSVTAADVHTVATEAYANALLQVPYGVPADTIGFTPAPTTSDAAVEGRRHAARSGDGQTLIVADDGVSVTDRSGSALTVRFAECAARLRWPDGASVFLGLDGITVSVEPTLYRVDALDLAALERDVPEGLTVTMPERSPDQIPQPERRGLARRPVRKTEFMILAPITGLLAWALVSLANAWRPEDGEFAEKLLLVLLVAVAVCFVRVFLVGLYRIRFGRW
ncbi:insulinase family protein [Micromonospora sp. WMMC415]|uniref:M16 family metallopeptidase n=1 Tax=Micromonospora sp. WMMC415 TaxID=2675222 RepID=UPI0012B481B1|nr:insulinase family protein [Micromonospora sp. WMMC415]QGN49171.1 insulinase family protein [Micromonospora sp. WMMC415]